MILTQDQLALENSLRRILPAGVVSCWIPDGYDRVKDIIGGNHGTCFGTHPNVPIISGLPIEQINACDAITGWTSNGSLSIDTLDKKEGTGSLKDTVASPNIGSWYGTRYNPSGSWDWSIKKDKLFWLYCDRASTAFSAAVFRVMDTSGNWRKWNLTFSAGEWTAFNLLLSAGDGDGPTSPDLALINYFYIEFNAKDETPFYKKIDDVRVTGRRSLTYPSVGWHFDYIDDYVDLGSNSSLNPATEIAIGAWVNGTYDATKHHSIIAKYGAGAANFNYYMTVFQGKLRGYLAAAEGGAVVMQSDTVLTSNVWYRFIFTAKSGTQKLYINANLDKHLTDTYAAIAASSEPLNIGGRKSGTENFLDGYAVLPFLGNKYWSQQRVENDYLHTKGLFAPRE